MLLTSKTFSWIRNRRALACLRMGARAVTILSLVCVLGVACSSSGGGPNGMPSDGLGGLPGEGDILSDSPGRRVLFRLATGNATDKIVDGPGEVYGWQSECRAGCASSSTGCGAFVPECDVWLSTSGCADPSKRTFTFATSFPRGSWRQSVRPFTAFAINDMWYPPGFPLAANESICVSLKDSANMDTSGWVLRPGSAAIAGTEADPATRTTFHASLDSALSTPTGVVVSGAGRVEGWDATCYAGCDATSSGCSGRVPKCEMWLSPNSDCSTQPPDAFTFAALFPSGSANSFPGTFLGFPLRAGETICASASDSAILDTVGWVSRAMPATAPDRRKPIHVRSSAATETLLHGPIQGALLDAACTANCDSSASGCMGLVPGCDYWLSKSGCSDSAPGVFDFGGSFPRGGLHQNLGPYLGLSLAGDESLCATMRDTAAVEVWGWGQNDTQSRPYYGGSGDPSRRQLFNVTSASPAGVRAIEGPLTINRLDVDCGAGCASSSTGCGGFVPECDVWLSPTGSCDPPTPSTLLGVAYARGTHAWVAPYDGLPLGPGEAICAGGKDSAIVTVDGVAERPPSGSSQPAPIAVSRRSRVSVTQTSDGVQSMALTTGPALIGAWAWGCEAQCASTSTGCAQRSPHCQLWIGQGGCADNTKPLAMLTDTPPLALGLSVYDGLPIYAGESLCATTSGSGFLTFEGWVAKR